MTELGADYSTARPGGAALKAAGVVAVGRYLTTDGRGIHAAEYADLKAHGIGVWLVRESQTLDLSVSMLNGYDRGVAEAKAALAEIARVGLPAQQPVFWAADFDIAPGSARVAQAEAYVDGWNTIIPSGRRGGYGGLWFLDYLHKRGKVDVLWECASTSFRHGVKPSQVPLSIQQTTHTPPVPGTDHNYIYDMAAIAGATPAKEEDDDMGKLLLHPDGTVGYVSPEGNLTVLKDMDEARSFQAVGLAPMEIIQLPDNLIWNKLTEITNRHNALVASIHDTVTQPVPRDGVNVSQAQDNANTGTLARQIAAQMGTVQTAVTQPAPVDAEAVATALAAKLPPAATAADVQTAINSLKLAATS